MPTQIKYLDYDGLVYYHSKVKTALGNKVDKVSGKGLSTNDFTNTLKNKLDGIAAGAQVNVIDGVNVNGSAVTPTNKIVNLTVPTKTSDLTNDSGFLTSIPTASASTLGGVKIGNGINVAADGTISAAISASLDWNDITNKPTGVSYWTNDAGYITSADIPTKTSDLINDSNFVEDANYVHTDNNYTTAEKSKLAGIAAGAEVNVQSDWATSDATFDSYIKNKPTIGNGKITIKKNGTKLTVFTANQTADVEANIIVPTTVAELSDASTYVTQNSLATQLANKQNVLTAGDHINITDSTIKAVDYVHSDNPVPASQVAPVVTNDMIAAGTITADKLASGATVKLTLSTSDIGEGAALAANTLYGVYQQ